MPADDSITPDEPACSFDALRNALREKFQEAKRKNDPTLIAATRKAMALDRAAKKRDRYLKDRQTYIERSKSYARNNPEKVKQYQETARAKTYGLTVEQVQDMIQSQGNRCLCCKTKFGLLKQLRPSIDHCHANGKVRGILCHRCNVTLGHAGDNPKILRAMARYIERHQEIPKTE